MKKYKRIVSLIAAIVVVLTMAICFAGCSEAEKVNYNMAKQAQYFECERKITVYNAWSDNIILECEGYMDISNNTTNELVVTCKVGPNEYKKNYIYLNDFTLYVVEDIANMHTDPYHYKMYFHTTPPIDVDIKP